MKPMLLMLACVLCVSSSAKAQMPPPPLTMIPGIGNAALAAQAGQAKNEATAKVNMAWSMMSGVIMIRNNYPDHWMFFNTNILLNTNVSTQKVIDGMQMCVDIDTLLGQADALIPPANTDTQSSVANWLRGDAELMNFRFSQSIIWFNLASSQAVSATDDYSDAYDKLADAELLYFDLTQIVPPVATIPGM